MRTALSSLELVRPKSLAHALDVMHAAGERPIPVAGGTDVYVELNAGTPRGARYVDLWGLRELRGIRVGAKGVAFGGLATFREIGEHDVVRRRLPALVAAAATVGAWQIQNRATIAGNVANASPAGDSLPVLLAHDAVVRVRSVRGERSVPFAELYVGYRKLALEPDELITAVEVPFPPAGSRTWYRKVGTRRAQTISKVVFCGVLHTRRGSVDHARLAYGSVAAVTVRARASEAALIGRAPGAAAAEAARAALGAEVKPIDDIRSTGEYRKRVAENLLAQFLRVADARFASA